MKKILFLSLLAVPTLLFGQARYSLYDRMTLAEMQQSAQPMTLGTQAEEQISVLVRVADPADLSALEAAGATVKQVEGEIVVVSAPLSAAQALADAQGVRSLSLSKELRFMADPKVISFNRYGIDRSREYIGLPDVHSGAGNLDKPYTGEGVIVGIIDKGIDFQHMAFRDADGKHRISRAWKHVVNGKATYTQTSDTPEKMAILKTDDATATHGTHVLGIATASLYDSKVSTYTGAAPGADIAVSCGYAGDTQVLDGLRKIADYAKAEGKPVVINISLGNNLGAHDGTDEFTTAVGNIAGEDGVHIFVASGNEGGDHAGLYHEFSAEQPEIKTIIGPTSLTAALYPASFSMFPQAVGQFEVWSEDATPVKAFIDFIDIANPSEPLASIEIPAASMRYLSTVDINGLSGEALLKDPKFMGAYINSYIGGEGNVDPVNNRHHFSLVCMLEGQDKDSYTNKYCALRLQGEPGKRVWVYAYPTSGYFGMGFESLNLDGYTQSTGDGTINALACAKNVIAVGAFISHNLNSDYFVQYPVGETAYFTSWGHHIDGRVLPDICAPGTGVVSAMSHDFYVHPSFADFGQPVFTSATYNDVLQTWTPMAGTSMACPFMTGTAALWLEADPNLTTEEIRQIAIETATAPSGDDVKSGAGHLDAFAGMCKVLGVSGINGITADGATGILLKASADGYLIAAPGASSISATLTDLQGRAHGSYSAFADALTVPVDGIAAGIYILSAQAGTTAKSFKIIVK